MVPAKVLQTQGQTVNLFGELVAIPLVGQLTHGTRKMKIGFLAARILSIIVIFAFAVPAFADSIVNLNGAQSTNGHFVQKLNLSDAGTYGNAGKWKGALGAPYVRAAKNGGGGMTAPEPGALSLLGTGLVFIAGMFRRKKLG